MARRFIEAANTGDVDTLHSLINDYAVVLKDMALDNGNTPLHIACIGGHVNFVKEVMNLVPDQFVEDLNHDGLSPLHIASARGVIGIVKELLTKVGNHLYKVKGKEEQIPLHCAVAKGRVVVIEELLLAWPNSIAEVTGRGDTSFHLAVKNNQFEALKFLCQHVISFNKEEILNNKDKQGNTILHLAASRKQYEVVNLLLDKSLGYKGVLEMSSSNNQGLTPLDVLVSEGGDSGIEEMLILAGAIGHVAVVARLQSPKPSTYLSSTQHDRELTRIRAIPTRRTSSTYLRSQEYPASRIPSTHLIITSCDREVFTPNTYLSVTPYGYPVSIIPSTYYLSITPNDGEYTRIREYPAPRINPPTYYLRICD